MESPVSYKIRRAVEGDSEIIVKMIRVCKFTV